jgi:hypothetical protein
VPLFAKENFRSKFLRRFVIKGSKLKVEEVFLDSSCKPECSRRLFDEFFIQNGMKQGEALSPSLSNLTIRKVQGEYRGLKFNGTHQPLVCADDASLLVENINTIMKMTGVLLHGGEEAGPEVAMEEIMCSCHQSAGENRNMKVASKFFETDRVQVFGSTIHIYIKLHSERNE